MEKVCLLLCHPINKMRWWLWVWAYKTGLLLARLSSTEVTFVPFDCLDHMKNKVYAHDYFLHIHIYIHKWKAGCGGDEVCSGLSSVTVSVVPLIHLDNFFSLVSNNMLPKKAPKVVFPDNHATYVKALYKNILAEGSLFFDDRARFL